MCFSPQRRAIFRTSKSAPNFILTFKCAFRHSGVQFFEQCQKVVPKTLFFTFWLSNVLFATAACNFFDIWTSKKWSKHAVFCTFWTFKCAFRHSGVQFFEHLNFQKWSRIVSFLTFSLPNVLFATAACNFWTSELQKVVPDPQILYNYWLANVLFATAACNFWCILSAPTSAPAALTGLLFDWPDTRIYEKTQHFVTSLTFGADVSSFF